MSQPQGFGFDSTSLTTSVGIVTLWVTFDLATLYQVEQMAWWIHFQVLMYGTITNIVYLAISNYAAGLTGNPHLLNIKPFLLLNVGITMALFGSIRNDFFVPVHGNANIASMLQLTFMGKVTYEDMSQDNRQFLLIICLIGMAIMLIAVGLLLHNIMRAREHCPRSIHYISVLKTLELSCVFFIIAIIIDCFSGILWVNGFSLNLAPASLVAFTFGWCTMPIIASLVSFVPAMLARAPVPYTEVVANRWLPLMGFAILFLLIGVVLAMLIVPYVPVATMMVVFVGIPSGLLSITFFMVNRPLFMAFSFNRPSLVGWIALIGTMIIMAGPVIVFAIGAFGLENSNTLILSVTMYGLRVIVIAFVLYAAESIAGVGLHHNPWLPTIQILVLVIATTLMFVVIRQVVYVSDLIKVLIVVVPTATLFVPMFVFKLPKRAPGEPTSRDFLVNLLQIVIDGPAQVERRYMVTRQFDPAEVEAELNRKSDDITVVLPDDSKTLPFSQNITKSTDDWMPN